MNHRLTDADSKQSIIQACLETMTEEERRSCPAHPRD
jgi:hypothetical protein